LLYVADTRRIIGSAFNKKWRAGGPLWRAHPGPAPSVATAGSTLGVTHNGLCHPQRRASTLNRRHAVACWRQPGLSTHSPDTDTSPRCCATDGLRALTGRPPPRARLAGRRQGIRLLLAIGVGYSTIRRKRIHIGPCSYLFEGGGRGRAICSMDKGDRATTGHRADTEEKKKQIGADWPPLDALCSD